MKRIVYGIFVLHVSALTALGALNAIDGGGGWGAIGTTEPYVGELVTEDDTLEKIEAVWNATHFYSLGGNGRLDIMSATEDTYLYLNNANNAQTYASGFTDLYLVATNGGSITANTGLSISGGDNFTILGGTYRPANTRKDASAAVISVSDTVLLYNTSIIGQASGNRGLADVLTISADTLIVDNDTEDEVFYGNSSSARTMTISVIPAGGEYNVSGAYLTGVRNSGSEGLTFSGSSMYTTNMNAVGGYGNTRTWNSGRYGTTLAATDGTGGIGADITAQTIRMSEGIAVGGQGLNQILNYVDQSGSMTTTGGDGIVITSANDLEISDLLAGGGFAGTATTTEADMTSLTATAGHAMRVTTISTNANVTGSFYGGYGNEVTVDGNIGNITVTPGAGILSQGSGINLDAELFGGYAGDIVIATNAKAIVASGGNGGSGIFRIAGGEFEGGDGATIYVGGSATSATANGGNALRTTGTSSISDGIFYGGDGGRIDIGSVNGTINALGGSGVYVASGTTTISGGTFNGGFGGSCALSNVTVNGGSGAYAAGGTLNITGGTFNGGYAGGAHSDNSTMEDGRGVSAVNASVTLDGETAVINDGLYFETTAGTKTLSLLSGTINGDIEITGTGTASLIVSNQVSAGAVNVTDGTGEVQLGSWQDAAFFDEVNIDKGSLSFVNDFALLSPDARFTINGTNSSLNFADGALLYGAKINANEATLSAGDDVVLTDGAYIGIDYGNPVYASSNRFVITGGDLVVSNSTFAARGTSSRTSGSLQLAQADNVDLEDGVLDVDFGWLTKISNISTNSGITADWEYDSLESRSSTSLAGITAELLAMADGVITNFSEADFAALNGDGETKGTRGIRYSLSQSSDIAATAFQVNRGIAGQLATRTSTFRAQNGFASTKAAPAGVAGPTEEKGLQGWIRAYTIQGDRAQDGTFAGYDSTVLGTVGGIDKSFGNLLVGLSGGFGRSEINASSTYKTESDNYHGSIYSTIAGNSVFVDLAVNYTEMKVDEESSTTFGSTGSFDATALSGYIGAGKIFKSANGITFTPEASMLASLYEQEAYIRDDNLIGEMAVDAYDEMSYLGSIGASISSIHTIEVLSQGIAVSPELRLHWQHEFNPDLDDGSYTLVSNPTISQALDMRAREEDFVRVGLGLDLWHWRYEDTKFEIDYDGLFSGDSDQHTISGKIAVQF